jgi:Icc-related predicted phosphoesterase
MLAVLLAACSSGLMHATKESFETVLYLGDPQIGFSGNATEDGLRFGVAAANAASHATAAVIAGDCVNSWDNATQISLFKSVWPSQFQRTPAHLVPGNHDVNSALSNATTALRQLAHFRKAFNTTDYSMFDTHHARFVLMNTETLILPFLGLNQTHDPRILSLAEVQWQFIESSLRAARSEAPSSRHLILVGHHPPFINDEVEPHTYYNMPLQPRKRLLALARSFGVRHLLCGHTHTTRTVSTSDGIRVLTTAGTARAFDSNGCGFQSLRISPTDVNITYTELPGGGGMPGCIKAPWAP